MDGAFAFIVMELLEGETLGQRLKRDKTLSPEATFRVMLHIARAVARAHAEGIVHRDLKPDNVFLVKNDDEEIAKVLDLTWYVKVFPAFDRYQKDPRFLAFIQKMGLE